MFKEEKYIEKLFGKANQFNVPKGYFEGFTSKMMNELSADGVSAELKPVVTKSSFWVRYRLAVGSVAAGVFMAVLSFGAYLYNDGRDEIHSNVQQASMVSSQQKTDASFDAIVDYSMMDGDDLYAYMSDAI